MSAFRKLKPHSSPPLLLSRQHAKTGKDVNISKRVADDKAHEAGSIP